MSLLRGAHDPRRRAVRRYAERLAAVWDYHRSPLFNDAEKAAFNFALAAASVPNAVSPEIGAALKKHWTDDEIVEILGVIALFGFLNRWNDSMATTLEGIGISGRRTEYGLEGLDCREAQHRWHRMRSLTYCFGTYDQLTA